MNSFSVVKEQAVWGKPDSLKWFAGHRQTVEELYPSERIFLPEVVRQVRSVLDIGCAAGGFCEIMKAFNPRLSYMGVDVVSQMLSAAASRFPDAFFTLTDGVNLPLQDGSVELVWSTGVLHLNSRYREIVREAWRISRRYLLCDFRLTDGASCTGRSDVNFDGQSPAKDPLPYVVLNTNELVRLLADLVPHPAAITIRGYPHEVSHMATGVPREVVMAFALVEKAPAASARPKVEIDIRALSAWA